MNLFATLIIAAVTMACELNAIADVALLNHQGTSITTTLVFSDETGSRVSLDSYFHHARPVLIVPVYFGCHGTCSSTLNQVTLALKRINASVGRAYEVVVISVDPTESIDQAVDQKRRWLEVYARPETAHGWHFLTGTDKSIQILTDELGFRFERIAHSKMISHPDALFVLSHEGILSKVLTREGFNKRAIWAAIYSSTRGQIDRVFDKVAEYCMAAATSVWSLWN